MPEIDDKIKEIVAEQLGLDTSKVELDSKLVSDLGTDSLDLVEIQMAIESEFDISIDDDEMEEVVSVGDFSEIVGERM